MSAPVKQAPPGKIAVIGAGMAGSACASELRRAGCDVAIFDKARGSGGRMATRRMEWKDTDGQAWSTALDHGAVALTGTTNGSFFSFVREAQEAGCLAPWRPRLADEAGTPAEDESLWVGTPDMPALCRNLLQGVETHWSHTVDQLLHGSAGWTLQAGGAALASEYAAVLLAIPAAQAVPLLAPHRSDWAAQAGGVSMHACWTLMGVTEPPTPDVVWDLARPAEGILDIVLRGDARPLRARVPGQAHWVAHATASFSAQALEDPSEAVYARLQAALDDVVGQRLRWRHGVVHRWRYAHVPPQQSPAAGQCWFDPRRGFGVCGDYLGGAGVEGAFASGQALARAVLEGAEWSSALGTGLRIGRTTLGRSTSRA